MFKSILVLESPWDTASVKSKSVWPFVSEFAKAMDLRAFHQAFSDKISFCHWINVFNKEKAASQKLLYVAAHGTDGRISGLQKAINGTTIVTALKKAKNVKYVHFGSCLYGSESNLASLLRTAKHISWAAGYDKSVDWVDSTLFDVMLWGRIARRDAETKGLRTHTLAQELMKEIPGLAQNLGFRFQYRYGKNVKSLFSNGVA
jgi:hypothetical protein